MKLCYTHVAILGMGVSGLAVSNFLKKKNISHFGVDKDPTIHQSVSVFADIEMEHLRTVDLVVKSPGIPWEHKWVQSASKKGIPIVGEIDLAFAEIKNKKLFAVTGSNGKTTTSLFLAHLIEVSGFKSQAVGNVGFPLISALDSDAEYLVVELSSFQLEKIVPAAVLDAAIILNITANHLDRHANFEEYVRAKFQIKKCLKKEGKLFVSKDISQRFQVNAQIFDAYQEKVETIFSLRYRDVKNRFFPHDLQNFSAAFAAYPIADAHFEKALVTFQKPAHRIEFVREINGVSFFNDSKATSVDAVLKAVFCMKGNVLLLAGGVDKGGSFAEWLPVFRTKVSKVFAFGKAKERISEELSSAIATEKVDSLEEAIRKAFAASHPGDVVLLSPGCASYDQFKDYQQRGQRFMEIVNSF